MSAAAPMTGLAALAAAAGCLLVWSPRPSRSARPAGRWRRWLVVAGGAALALAGSSGLRIAVLVLIATLTIASATGLWRAGARRRAAATVSARVLETCVLLASELAAGRPADAALARAADEWPPLGPAAEAGALGSDVPSSLRVLAGIEGAADLRLLAAAWEVAHRTGHGLAATVALVADDLRAAQATRRVVESELASARATARLVALLPLPVLVLGSGTGGDPLGFLFGTPLGLTCLGGGLGLGIAGLWWIEAIAAAVPGPRAHPGGW